MIYRQANYQYRTAASSGGMYVTGTDGKEYLDMSGGAAVISVGHQHPVVLARIRDQLEHISFAHTAFFTHEPQEELASRLAGYFPEPGSKVYFSSGGSEANETALKLAWQYWQAKGQSTKKIIISRESSYHGNTLGTLSVSGNAGRRKRSAAPLLEWPRIDPYYPLRFKQANETEHEYALRAAEQLKNAILSVGPDNVAAFICEPVVGSSLGVVAASQSYLVRIREICDEYDILLICDEIMCGSGRTGSWFAHDQYGIVADIVTLAKGIAGGYQPLAATIVRKHIASALSESGFAHGHTYISHPLACAAGCGVLDVLESENLLAGVEEKRQRLTNALETAFANHPNVAEIRSSGLFVGIELVADLKTLEGFTATKLEGKLRELALQNGLICYPGEIQWEGKTVPHIMLAPPLIVEQQHIDECVLKLQDTLRDFVVCLTLHP